MPRYHLQDFVDIISNSGTPKATKVAQVKDRPDYEPAFDFYKPLRDCIIDAHQSGADKKAFSTFFTGVTDAKKRANYPSAIDGYRKWWGRKKLTWFEPPARPTGDMGSK